MEAALLDFILDVGAVLLANVTKHLGEHPLQRVVAHLATDGVIAVVADVESGAVEVARVVRSIAVVALQTGYVFLGAQHAGDDELVQGHTLHVEAVVERLTDVLQQDGSTRHEVGNGAVELVDMVVGTLADIHQFLLAGLGILAVLHRTHAPLVGSDNLHALAVRKCHLVVGDRENAVVFAMVS